MELETDFLGIMSVKNKEERVSKEESGAGKVINLPQGLGEPSVTSVRETRL